MMIKPKYFGVFLFRALVYQAEEVALAKMFTELRVKHHHSGNYNE